ncbi:MAG: N-acetylmuramoyl-L-alanine amidase family protein [Prevotella sp.]
MYKKFFSSLFMFLMFALVIQGANKRFTLVIDAGHGGRDHGASGATSNEKDLTLKYALSLGKMIERNCPDVRVLYTRKTDVFVTLKNRADFANNKHADLFISVHINALPRHRIGHGFQSYTLGRGRNTGDKGIKENLDVAKRENSVIYLEEDYKTVYKGFNPNSVESDIMFEFIADKNRERSVELSRLMQQEVCRATGRKNGGSHQNNLAVLRLTSMPAILLELGFISTQEEEQFLNSNAGLDLYTKGMYNAFIRYMNKYDDNVKVPYRNSKAYRTKKMMLVEQPKPEMPKEQETLPKETSTPEMAVQTSMKPAEKSVQDNKVTQPKRGLDESKPVFKVQIFVSKNLLKADDGNFKGLKGCEYYEENNYRKYTYGASTNYNEIYRLRKQILEQFPECFIIAFKNGKKINVNEGIREFKANR